MYQSCEVLGRVSSSVQVSRAFLFLGPGLPSQSKIENEVDNLMNDLG